MSESKARILYIDDDQDFLDAVRVVLEANGYEMMEARSAEDGLRVYKAERPDFILVDLMMEEVDAGIQFAKDLRASGNTAPVYVLSSVGDNLSATVGSTGIGLDGILQKPMDPDALLALIQVKLAAI